MHAYDRYLANQPAPMTAEQLAADIASTNNGYLFAPTGWQMEAARAHPDKFITRPNAFGTTSIYITMKTTKYATIEAAKAAAIAGETVHWDNPSYQLKVNKWGDFNVVCVNGFCTPLSSGHHSDEFYTPLTNQPETN